MAEPLPDNVEGPEDRGKKSRTWKMTLNNWTETELAQIKQWDVKRLAIAFENCDETGTALEGKTRHLQIFVTFPRTMSFNMLKKMAPRAWIQVSMVADWNYEMKTDSAIPTFVINNTKQGKRTDVDAAYESAAKRRSLYDYVMAEQPGYQAIKLYQTLRAVLTTPRAIGPVEVHWFYGPTGTGKTRSAWESYPELFCVNDNSKWWDGYDGQLVVLIDDFRPSWCSFAELLRLTDIYPLRKEVKGGFVHLQFTTLIITTPHSPEDTFGDTDEDMGQLLRRLTTCTRFPRPEIVVISDDE